MLDQADIDGELAVPGDEFLGAVERVDQPERRIADVGDLARGHRLLGHDRDRWGQLAQAPPG